MNGSLTQNKKEVGEQLNLGLQTLVGLRQSCMKQHFGSMHEAKKKKSMSWVHKYTVH